MSFLNSLDQLDQLRGDIYHCFIRHTATIGMDRGHEQGSSQSSKGDVYKRQFLSHDVFSSVGEQLFQFIPELARAICFTFSSLGAQSQSTNKEHLDDRK